MGHRPRPEPEHLAGTVPPPPLSIISPGQRLAIDRAARELHCVSGEEVWARAAQWAARRVALEQDRWWRWPSRRFWAKLKAARVAEAFWRGEQWRVFKAASRARDASVRSR